MGLFSRKKDAKSKNKGGQDQHDQQPAKPAWTDGWARSSVEPEEIHELVKGCTGELKKRALDHPFLLLPFRPTSDPSAARNFIRHFFDGNGLRGEVLAQELRMAEPMVVAGVIKWCWSRLQNGVVGWDAYELFKVGEQDSNMARDSFKTFIPLSVENGARTSIIFNFFDLLSAIAAHGKMNGLGGRKLSRMAAWWAFEQKDTGTGFDGGYKEWLKAADATSHLFFAYLRTLAPEQQGPGTISMIPRSLQALLQDTEYPPTRPVLMQASTYKVVMIVESVSPTPFSLLRRGNHFQYREDSLQQFSEYEDPVAALTEECRRVLRAIAAANQTQAVSSAKHSTSLRDASWSRFEDIGFGGSLEDDDEDDLLSSPHPKPVMGLRTTPASGNSRGRPTTPSWADFLSSGFVDGRTGSPTNLLRPDQQLPPIDIAVRQNSSQSHRPRLASQREIEQGELASINPLNLDEAFWWVWMNSLAPEETPDRKAAFGRCAVIETIIRNGRWLVFEEVVKGAAPEPQDGAYVAQKKSFFSWRRKEKDKNGVTRRKSTTGKKSLDKHEGRLKTSATTGAMSKSSLGPDQQAKIHAAAQQLQAKQERDRNKDNGLGVRRGRTDAELMAEKTQSVMTLQPMIMKEASPAMKWANRYDKDTIREAYLANGNAGRGLGQTTMQSNGLLGGGLSEEPEPSPSLRQAPSVRSTAEDRRAGAASPFPAASVKGPHDEAANSMELMRDAMVSPEPAIGDSPKQNKLRKGEKNEKNGGFRKLFSRGRRASKVPDEAPGDLTAFLSDGRDAPTPEPQPSEAPPRADTPQQASPGHQASRTQQPVYKEPTYEPSEHSNNSFRETESRVATADAEEAQNEFARFDQGPLADQPAFVPDDTEDDATPPPFQRRKSPVSQPQPESPPRPAPAPTSASGPAPERKTKPRPRVVERTGPQTAPAIERWAQIRKNAAERAAQASQRVSEDKGPSPAAAKPQETIDAGGEESIESRVARIKARVAELTGNMEGAQAPGGPRPPVPR
ncbi:unnamed protein product [Discula destructiva]